MSSTNDLTTKQQNNKTTKKQKNIFFFLFLFITNKIITFAPANSSGQGENPDRRYSPRACDARLNALRYGTNRCNYGTDSHSLDERRMFELKVGHHRFQHSMKDISIR